MRLEDVRKQNQQVNVKEHLQPQNCHRTDTPHHAPSPFPSSHQSCVKYTHAHIPASSFPTHDHQYDMTRKDIVYSVEYTLSHITQDRFISNVVQGLFTYICKHLCSSVSKNPAEMYHKYHVYVQICKSFKYFHE